MGVPQSPTPPHLYPQALQLKLYQAFIFSIPILFSIILFLLFYLFYLKRRASNTLSSPLPPRPRRSHQTTTYISSPCHQLDLKVELKDELPIVLFDEELRKRDSQCCVCLGDFVMKEELLQVPSCKHVFHVDCIHLWLHTNTTCPLCRCSVLPATTAAAKLGNPNPAGPPSLSSDAPLPPQGGIVSNQSPQLHVSLEQHDQQQEEDSSTTTTTSINIVTNSSREELIITSTPIDHQESSSSGISTSTNSRENENNTGCYTDQAGSVVIYIQTHGTSVHEAQMIS
ncbi:43kDa postsynaptic protein [Trema orientale]|uniref:RING-type E3 ubiquitin transferase n=1 Tax=Trema orientale TaxID=63057 RepID=A0A2P5D6P9_TREOI|nr:43kDa postsynaptic protein [Trema orientale]